MADDMVNAKSSTLRIREANPCKDVRPPDRGVKKAKQYQELRRLAETKSRHTRRVPRRGLPGWPFAEMTL
jgi:hypothetical protein